MSEAVETRLVYPDRDDIQLVEVLQALGDPIRIQLVRLLDRSNGEIACSEFGLPVAKSTASHHLKVMREAGLVTARFEGTRRFYTLRRDDIEARFPGLLATVLRADEHAATYVRRGGASRLS
jgi:DNA-binding transcriptional ArsR family regulator